MELNSQIHLVSTSELIENDSLDRKITQAINKPVKISEFQTLNCLSFRLKNVHYVGASAVEIHKMTTNMATVFPTSFQAAMPYGRHRPPNTSY